MSTRNILHGVTTAAIILGSPLSADDRPLKSYPIRWTDAVKIVALDEIPAVLSRPIPMPEHHGVELRGGVDGKMRKEPTTGHEYLALKRRGFYAYNTVEITMESWAISWAGVLDALLDARPSQTSHVGDMDFRQLDLDDYPWDKAGRPEELEVKRSATKLDITEPGFQRIDNIMAWGDFNRDGIEDVLLMSYRYYTEGSGRYFYIQAWTRRSAAGPVEVIELSRNR